MRLHVLAGCRELLQPEFLTPEMVAGLIGPRVRVATAFWITSEYGNNYHAFLQDESGDCRTQTMALALKDGFGARFEPLLVLADLLDEIKLEGSRALSTTAEDRRSQLAVLTEILACGHVQRLHLHGLAIPAKADPDESWAIPTGLVAGTVRERMERLRTASAIDIDPDAVETQVIEASPDLSVFNTVYNNSLCNQFVLRLAPRLGERGWRCDTETLGAAIYRILADWNEEGIFPTMPLRAEHLDAMTEVVYEKLL